jgi:imidazolonepropionase-like amidohydrolase
MQQDHPFVPIMTIIIEGNRITALDKASKSENSKKNSFIINGSGKYLIPGLWDMHFHVFNNVSKTPPDGKMIFLY